MKHVAQAALTSHTRDKLMSNDSKYERLNESELGGNTWKHNLGLESSHVTTSLDEALLKASNGLEERHRGVWPELPAGCT
jgi:hypothetical protein